MKETVRGTSDRVTCTLTEDGQAAIKKGEGRSSLFGSITAAREMSDGFELAFPAGSVAQIREFVAAESQCCGFLTFTIDEREDETRLTLSGPEGTKAFVRGMIPEGVPSGA